MDWMGIIDWLGKQNQVMGLYDRVDPKMAPQAEFDPTTKEITRTNRDKMLMPQNILGHELIHALQFSNLPNRFQATVQQLTDLQGTIEGRHLVDQMAYPTHWMNGQVEDERTQVEPGTPLYSPILKTGIERFNKTVKATSRYSPALRPYEQQAYYLTTPIPGIENPNRQLGMYLRNYGIPWDYIK
jgi:hypothetical protein